MRERGRVVQMEGGYIHSVEGGSEERRGKGREIEGGRVLQGEGR